MNEHGDTPSQLISVEQRECPTLRQSVDMLDMLGSALAGYLLDQGARGKRFYSGADPASQWLVLVTGAVAARTDSYMIEVRYADGRHESVYTPHTIAQFLVDFDNDEYPELVA